MELAGWISVFLERSSGRSSFFVLFFFLLSLIVLRTWMNFAVHYHDSHDVAVISSWCCAPVTFIIRPHSVYTQYTLPCTRCMLNNASDVSLIWFTVTKLHLDYHCVAKYVGQFHFSLARSNWNTQSLASLLTNMTSRRVGADELSSRWFNKNNNTCIVIPLFWTRSAHFFGFVALHIKSFDTSWLLLVVILQTDCIKNISLGQILRILKITIFVRSIGWLVTATVPFTVRGENHIFVQYNSAAI